MTEGSSTPVYVNEMQIEEYFRSFPAVIIDSTVWEMTADNDFYDLDLSGVTQFEVEIYVFCTKSDPESQSEWWRHAILDAAQEDNLDASNVVFSIYPDDENNPNGDLCECGEWDEGDHECSEDEDD